MQVVKLSISLNDQNLMVIYLVYKNLQDIVCKKCVQRLFLSQLPCARVATDRKKKTLVTKLENLKLTYTLFTNASFFLMVSVKFYASPLLNCSLFGQQNQLISSLSLQQTTAHNAIVHPQIIIFLGPFLKDTNSNQDSSTNFQLESSSSLISSDHGCSCFPPTKSQVTTKTGSVMI